MNIFIGTFTANHLLFCSIVFLNTASSAKNIQSGTAKKMMTVNTVRTLTGSTAFQVERREKTRNDKRSLLWKTARRVG